MLRILVIDDEAIIAMTMADWLADLGHVVVGPAFELGEALALCELPLDAALLDAGMGARSTETVAARLLARGVPFAVASGHDVTSLKAALSQGLVLSKPFGFETFRRTVELLLGAPQI